MLQANADKIQFDRVHRIFSHQDPLSNRNPSPTIVKLTQFQDKDFMNNNNNNEFLNNNNNEFLNRMALQYMRTVIKGVL